MDKTLETTLQFVPVTEDSMEYLLNHVVLGLVCTYWGDTRRYTLMPVQLVRNKRSKKLGWWPYACHVTEPRSFESVTQYAILPTEIKSQDGTESIVIDDGTR